MNQLLGKLKKNKNLQRPGLWLRFTAHNFSAWKRFCLAVADSNTFPAPSNKVFRSVELMRCPWILAFFWPTKTPKNIANSAAGFPMTWWVDQSHWVPMSVPTNIPLTPPSIYLPLMLLISHVSPFRKSRSPNARLGPWVIIHAQKRIRRPSCREGGSATTRHSDAVGKACSKLLRVTHREIPSGYVKIAIENGHWNSGFTH